MKQFFTLFIIVLVGGMGIWYFVYRNPALETTTLTSDQVIAQQQQDYPLGEYLPYENDELRLEYSEPLTLTVQLKKEINVEDFVAQFASLHGVDISNHTVVVQ